MSDVTPPPAGSPSAGAVLRAARQARGLDMDALAQVLKVPQRKLVSLEADRYDELPGLSFVRSLAQSYARQVGLDVAQVLALLPNAGPPAQQRLERVSRGLETPYREGAGSNPFGRSTTGLPDWLKPAHLVPALVLLAALAFWFAPPMQTMFGAVGWPSADPSDAASTTTTVEAAPVVVVSSPAPVVPSPAVSAPVMPAVSETVHSTPPPAPAEASAPPAVSGAVVLRTTGESWVEVRDAAGAVLLSRTVLPGEVIGLDGAFPMRLKAGIASVMQVSVRGESFDLAPFTRGNVATATLK